MARSAGSITDTLLARVRQTGAPGTTNDFAMQILSKCQRIVNAGLKRVTASTSYTTAANTLVYLYRNTLTSAVDILTVKEGTRELQRCDSLLDLEAYDADWPTTTGTRFEFWLQLGRDLLILYPAKIGASSVTVIYSTLTTEYDNYAEDSGTNTDLSDEDINIALGIAEVVLLLRNKQIALAQSRAKVISEVVQKHLAMRV